MRKWLFFCLLAALIGGVAWWVLRRKTTIAEPPLAGTGPVGTGTVAVQNPISGQPGNDSQEIINPEALPDQVGTDSTSGQTGVTPPPIGFLPGTYVTSLYGTDFLGSGFVTAPFQYNANYDFI